LEASSHLVEDLEKGDSQFEGKVDLKGLATMGFGKSLLVASPSLWSKNFGKF